jgi:hypothetical protein
MENTMMKQKPTSRTSQRGNSQCSILAVLAVAALTLPFVLRTAHADVMYTTALLDNGQSSATLNPGDAISLDFEMTPSGAYPFNAASFTLDISGAGALYDAYQWSSPFTTGGTFDNSTPSGSTETEITYDNFALTGSFTSGTLLTAQFTVPAIAAPGSQITLTPDFNANSFVNGPTSYSAAGQAFTVDVAVPEPSSVCIFAAAASAMLWHGRSRRFESTGR